MTMRPFTDNRGGLNHLVDAQIGRAFPVVHKVYEHLDAIEYIAQVYEAGRARDIVIRTNHTKEWIEWQYKGDAKWTILFKFGDLLGADIADVVATEQAIAAELVQLRQQLATDAKNVIAARDAANAAHSGAEAARTAAETARDVAQASETAAAQYAQNLEDAKTVVQVSANQVAADRLLAEQAAHNAEVHAGTAGSHVTTVIEARQAAEEFAAEANAAKSATALLQTAAEQSQIAAMNSASAAAASATAAGVSAQTAAAHQTATEAAAITGAKHLADIQAQVVSAETIKQETVDAYQAGLAAKVSAEAAAAGVVEARQTMSTMHGAVEQLHDETRVMLLSVESLHGETQVFRNEAEQMRIDAQVVAADRQRAEDAYAGAQSAATQAGVAADRAATSEQASVGAATTAATAAAELSGLLTDIDSRLDGAETLRTQVQLLHDQTLEYKNTVQDSTVNAQAVANDRAAVTAMMGTIAADAASAADSKDQALAAAATAVQAEAAANTAITVAQSAAQEVANNSAVAQDAAAAALSSQTSASDSATQAAASLTAVVPLHTEVVTKHAEVLVRADQVAEDLLAADAAKNAAETAQADAEAAEALARAWASKMDGPVLNDGGDKFSAQYWATQAEQSAIDAADANTGVLGALVNHTAAADPHTQYLTKAESTDAFAAKVDKEVGKGLSTEDFTTAERAKLASVETGANAYTHPDNHSASIITQDENNRFVSDVEKAAWNAKQDTLVSGTNLKTINGESLLGGGDLVVAGGGGGRGGPTLQGDTTPYIAQTKTYQITNFNSFSSYTVSASAGTASISGDVITYTTPSTAGNVDLTLTVDGQPTVFVINVQTAGVAKPTNISPTDGATGIPDSPILQSSNFTAYGLPDTHLASRWTVYQGGTQVHSSGWRTDALTSYTVPVGVVVVAMPYTWTVEHRGTTLGDSPASTATSFTTATSFNNYIPTPTPTPANFGDPLEGGFYAGMIWNQLVQSATSMTLAMGSKTFTVPDMRNAPIVYEGQTVEVRSRANPTNKFVGTVTGALGTSLTINVTSIGGKGTFSDWSVMARHHVIVAPKASGERSGIAIKNAQTALPTACQTLTEGFAATKAMYDADSSTVYPAAHWARSLNIGGHTDWFIPARDQLELCWRNLKPVAASNSTVTRPDQAVFNYTSNGSYGDTTNAHGLNNNSSPTGAAYSASVPTQTTASAFRAGGAEAFASDAAYYLSSSEYGTPYVWIMCFTTSGPVGYQGDGYKTGQHTARAIRTSVI